LEFIVNPLGKDTIYDQLIFQVKLAIANGTLQAGDILPSVRGLAKSLSVSTISVQRAYGELQKEGIIESAEGKGNFVSAGVSKASLKDALIMAVEDEARRVIHIAKQNGISRDELTDLIQLLWEDFS